MVYSGFREFDDSWNGSRNKAAAEADAKKTAPVRGRDPGLGYGKESADYTPGLNDGVLRSIYGSGGC